MSHEPLFSVIVPTYNRPNQIAGLLRSFADQDFPREHFEVLLVDDGSAVALDSYVEPFRSLLALRLLRQENQGCSAARNRGAAEARGKFLAFTDDDCRPVRGWLSALASGFVQDPRKAVAGPTLNGIEENHYSAMTQEIVNHLVHADGGESEVEFAPTSNIAFPAEAFRRVNGLDSAWKLAGGEDRVLCSRWRRAGYLIHFDSRAIVYHHHEMNLRQYLRQHFNYGRGAYMWRSRQTGGAAFDHRRFLRERVGTRPGRLQSLACFALAQAATAAGFSREWLKSR